MVLLWLGRSELALWVAFRHCASGSWVRLEELDHDMLRFDEHNKSARDMNHGTIVLMDTLSRVEQHPHSPSYSQFPPYNIHQLRLRD